MLTTAALHYFMAFVIAMTLAIMYQRHLEKQFVSPATTAAATASDYDAIQKYFLAEHADDLIAAPKPILWIHIPYEYNARDWLNFGLRSSYNLNQPYLHLTVKSIIKSCDESFKIVIIDDTGFAKLLPEWSIHNMSEIADPIKSNVRQLGMAKLLYRYGGIQVPVSFLCFRDLITMYDRGTRNDSMFVIETVNQSNIHANIRLYYPSTHMMGCDKTNPTMKEFIEYIARKTSTDFTAQSGFLGDFDRWCAKRIDNQHLRLIKAVDVGMKTTTDEPVTVETLLGDDYIAFFPKLYGIMIPAEDILKRTHYAWFAYLSAEEIFDSQFILAKYFVLALAPDAHLGVIEPLTTMDVQRTKPHSKKTDWISFWRVPLSAGALNAWGMKPYDLGDNVPRAKNAGDFVRRAPPPPLPV